MRCVFLPSRPLVGRLLVQRPLIELRGVYVCINKLTHCSSAELPCKPTLSLSLSLRKDEKETSSPFRFSFLDRSKIVAS